MLLSRTLGFGDGLAALGNLTAPVGGMRFCEISQSMASLEMNCLASFLLLKDARVVTGSVFSLMVTENLNRCSETWISVYTGSGVMALAW